MDANPFIGLLLWSGLSLSAAGAQGSYELRAPDAAWLVRADTARAQIVHLGMDSERTGRELKNLLSAPLVLEINGTAMNGGGVARDRDGTIHYRCAFGDGVLLWTLRQSPAALSWILEWRGPRPLSGVAFRAPLAPALTPLTVLPHDIDGLARMVPPWLLVAPDYGHLLIRADSEERWRAVLKGTRRGDRKSSLELLLYLVGSLKPGATAALTFECPEIQPPPGFDDPATWKRIRRPWLNIFQATSTWAGAERSVMLANNSLSDVAGISFHYYSGPIRMHPVPIDGIDLRVLLRRTLDYWLRQPVRGLGNVAAFGDYDLYLETNANLIVAAWDYWKASGDTGWVRQHAERLHHVADFLVRRDQDFDGLTESLQSGNRWSLRDPDRADAWWEMVNFGGINAWTNSQAYRAYLSMAEMLEAIGLPGGGKHYRERASRLKAAYFPKFSNPKTGWLAGWISQDGRMHDYCHVNVVGRAVAYGLVPETEARRMMERVVAKSRSIGFDAWDLGVPMNLIPILREDTIQPRRQLDGSLASTDWALSDDGTASFGKVAYNGIVSPTQTLFYLLGLQAAGLNEEVDRILGTMLPTAEAGGFQNGVVNEGFGGAEHRRWDRGNAGYEGYLSDNWGYLLAHLTAKPELRRKLLTPTSPD